MKKQWVLYKPIPEVLSQELGRLLGLDPLFLQLLYNRKLEDGSQIQEFLEPGPASFSDPAVLIDAKKAVSRIQRAISKKEKVIVFGDYDVDGISSTVLLVLALGSLGANVDFYIPERVGEGYGLNKKAILDFSKQGFSLIITVDCGISSVSEVEFANQLGLDVIITDHHQTPKILPPAYAILHPERSNKASSVSLAGVAVAFKLVQLLLDDDRLASRQYLDLVALGTVCDVVPFLGENRAFLKNGLHLLNSRPRPGIKALLARANSNVSKIDPFTIGYIIGPRLNAAGRLDHANLSARLLLSNDQGEIEILADRLEELNRERQKILELVLEEARRQVLEKINDEVLIVSGRNWHEGIIGLIASSLAKEFLRPVFAIGVFGDLAKGSARSGDLDVNIVRLLEVSSAHLLKFGGHSRAAGFLLETENLGNLSRKLLLAAKRDFQKERILPKIMIESKIGFCQINKNLLDFLSRLEPFGEANPPPIFLSQNVKVLEAKPVGADNQHLKMKLFSDGCRLDAIGFSFGGLAKDFYYGSLVDIVYTIEENLWNGRKDIRLKIIDLKRK